MALNTPVLFLTFTRFDTAIKVFDQIRQQQPKMLFIASDGPRTNKPDDIEQVKAVREHVLKNIDWECEVRTLFRENNLGCGVAVYQAISWFFEHVEQGIILEDDCLPYPDFFTFCEVCLNKYKNDERIWEISGSNFQGGVKRGDASYYFSNYGGIWGWATWARAWKHYDYEMLGFPNFLAKKKIETIFADKAEQKYWIKTLTEASKLGSSWDYQWVYTFWNNNGKCIVPNVNLVVNIGFDATGGTYTFGEPEWYKQLSRSDGLIGEIKHPVIVEVNTPADDFLFKKAIRPKGVLKRIFMRVKNRLVDLNFKLC